MQQFVRNIFYIFILFFPITVFCQDTGKGKIIYFEPNSSTLDIKSMNFLDTLIKTKQINKRQYLLVYGYSDTSKDKKQCELISNARAIVVRNYIISKGLSDYNFLICTGLGFIDSISSSTDNKQFYNNVEIITENIKAIKVSTVLLKKCAINEVAVLPEDSTIGTKANLTAKFSTFDAKTISVKLKNNDEFFGTLNKKNKKIDYGVYVWANGEKYAGRFKNDKKHGHGVYKWKNGDMFEGEWRNDKPIYGKLTSKNPSKYVLKIVADKDCKVLMNNTFKGNLKSDIVSEFYLIKGSYKLNIISNEDTNNVFATYYMVKKYGKEDLLNIKFGSKTDTSKPIAKAILNDKIEVLSESELKTGLNNIVKKKESTKPKTEHIIDSTQIEKIKEITVKEQTKIIPSPVIIKDSVVKAPIITDNIISEPSKISMVKVPIVKDNIVIAPIVTDSIVTAPIIKDSINKAPIIKDSIFKDSIVSPKITDVIDTSKSLAIDKPIEKKVDTVKQKKQISKKTISKKKAPVKKVTKKTKVTQNSSVDYFALAKPKTTYEIAMDNVSSTKQIANKPIDDFYMEKSNKTENIENPEKDTSEVKKSNIDTLNKIKSEPTSKEASDKKALDALSEDKSNLGNIDKSLQTKETINNIDTLIAKKTEKAIEKKPELQSKKQSIPTKKTTKKNIVKSENTTKQTVDKDTVTTIKDLSPDNKRIDTSNNKKLDVEYPKIEKTEVANQDTLKNIMNVSKEDFEIQNNNKPVKNNNKNKKHVVVKKAALDAPNKDKLKTDTTFIALKQPEKATKKGKNSIANTEIIKYLLPNINTNNDTLKPPFISNPNHETKSRKTVKAKKPLKVNKKVSLPNSTPDTIVYNKNTIEDEYQEDSVIETFNDYVVTSPFPLYDTSNSMMYVKGGNFDMGCDNCGIEAKPVHNVTLTDFYISKNEVSVREFRNFIKATGYRTTAEQEAASWIYGYNIDSAKEKILKKQSKITWEYDENGIKRDESQYDEPVLHVSWYDATQFCEWLSKVTMKKYRLPTEAEWEYVASLASKKIKKNELNNMTGLVWEWCSDWYEIEYYSQSQSKNPVGPPIGSMKVLRGGSWAKCNGQNRITCRYFNYPEITGCYISFRLAKTK